MPLHVSHRLLDCSASKHSATKCPMALSTPYLYMQKVQNGGSKRVGIGIDPDADAGAVSTADENGLVITVVIVTIENEHDARSTWLAHTVKTWKKSARGPSVRIFLHQVAQERDVLPLLLKRVLPKLKGPVVVMRGNTTALLNVSLNVWIERWMASDAPIWCTGVVTTACIEQWYLEHVLQSAVSKQTSNGGVCIVPVWGVFSGVAAALTAVLTPYTYTQHSTTEILHQLAARGDVHCDVTPLIDVGIDAIPNVVVGLSAAQSEKLARLCTPAPFLERVRWKTAAAFRTRDGKYIAASCVCIIVLVLVVTAMACALAASRCSTNT